MDRGRTYRLGLAAGALLVLAACQDGGQPGSNGLSSIFNSNAPSTYGSSTAAEQARAGCASRQQADLLHQNRPGGSDYDPARCHIEGY